MSAPRILISEVGPRDGLQSIKNVMPTAAKLRWISALAAAGLKEIEVGAFVPPKLLPQMADIREVVLHALSIPGLQYAPITKPHDLFDDPHLLSTGGLVDVILPADASTAGHTVITKTALLPLTLGGERLKLRAAPPSLGQDTQSLLMQLGYSPEELRQLVEAGVVRSQVPQAGERQPPRLTNWRAPDLWNT